MHKALHTRDDVDRLYLSRKMEEEDLPTLKKALTHQCNDSKTILWDFAIQTHRKIKKNRTNPVVLIVIAAPTDNYITIKEYNKICKYNGLEIEIEKM